MGVTRTPEPGQPEEPGDGLLFGRYERRAEVGRGGMATVLCVFDTVLERTLALKLLAPEHGPATPDEKAELYRRFEVEAKLAASLEHPGVVPVHDLHVGDDGSIGFTMPLIEGADLLEVFERVAAGDPPWTVTRAVDVIRSVCEVVGFAHSRGVVHRDLKPENVRVGAFGEVYVLDWGLARPVTGVQVTGVQVSGAETEDSTAATPAGRDSASVRETRVGTVLGTPSFMPPEQAAGRLEDVGPAADVYAAGAILYNLLAGRAPYSDPRIESSADELVELVRRGPPPPLERFAGDMPGELIAICERAMQRDPEARYPDLSAMTEDLRAFLEGRVVGAYEHGTFAQFRKFVTRNRALSIAVGSAVLIALVAMAVVTWVHTRVNQRLEANSVEMREARDDALEAAYDVSVVNAFMRIGAADVAGCRDLLLRCPRALRGWDWHHVWQRLDASLTTVEAGGGSAPTCVAATADLQLIGRADGAVEILDLQDFDQLEVLDAGLAAPVDLAMHDGSDSVYALTSKGCLHRLARDGQRHDVIQAEGVLAIAATADSVVSCGVDGAVQSWRDGRSKAVLDPIPGEIVHVAFSADGRWIATLDRERLIRIRGLDGESVREPVRIGVPATCMALDPEGERVAVANSIGGLRVIDATSGGEFVAALRGYSAIPITVLRFHPTSGVIVFGDGNGSIGVWDREAGTSELLAGHEGRVVSICFAGGGALIASCSADSRVRFWGVGVPAYVSFFAGTGSVACSVRFRSDGLRCLTATVDGQLVVRDALSTGGEGAVWATEPLVDAAFADHGETVLAVTASGAVVRAVDGVHGTVETVRSPQSGATALATGARCVVGHRDGTVAVLDSDATREIAAWPAHDQGVVRIACTPRGDRIATLAEDGGVRIWDGAGERIAEFALGGPSVSLALSADGRYVAVGGVDGVLRIAAIESGRVARRPTRGGVITAVGMTGDGARVVTGGSDGSVLVWNRETGRQLLALESFGSPVASVAFDPTGQRLLVASEQHGTRIFESTPLSERPHALQNAVLEAVRDAARSGARLAESGAAASGAAEGRDAAAPHRAAHPTVYSSEERAHARAAELRELVRARVYTVAVTASEAHAARRRAQAAALLEPNHPASQVLLGATLVRCGQLHPAELVLQDALSAAHAPTQVTALAFLVLAQSQLGNRDEARASLDALRRAVGERSAELEAGPAALVEEAELSFQEIQR